MGKILFINNVSEKCGIYQYGRRLHDILKKSNRHEYIYVEVASLEQYNEILKSVEHDYIAYNYSLAYFGWLTNETIQREKKNACIYHEFSVPVQFDAYVNTDSTHKDVSDGWFVLPRPLFEGTPLSPRSVNKVPTIGSFGLALPQKGFERIIKTVNKEFGNAVIRLHIPNSQFADANGLTAGQIIERCIGIKRKSGIALEITTHFLDDLGMLDFLNGNDLNVFMYDPMGGRGLSSVIDYALSVDRPIGLSDSLVFRHVYGDGTCLYRNSMSDLIKNGTVGLKEFKEVWSNKNLIDKMDNIISEIA